MTDRGNFNWSNLGKADYSQTHALVASLPEGIRKRLTAPQWEVLCRITYLCWSFAQRSGRGKAYAIPSERYLAAAVCRSERTVRRCLTVLKSLKLLTWVSRKSSRQEWLTNLYSLGDAFLAMLYARMKGKSNKITQRTLLTDNDLKKEYQPGELDETPGLLEKLLQKARLKRDHCPAGAGPDTAPDWHDDVDPHHERRALLRKQAQWLKEHGL